MDEPARRPAPGGQGRGAAGRRTNPAAAALAGSFAVLILAAVVGGALGSLAKAACRAGAWNIGVEQYQAHCYTDIYPLYFGEGLSKGQVPYFGHHVEYPVVMGAAAVYSALVLLANLAADVALPLVDPRRRA